MICEFGLYIISAFVCLLLPLDIVQRTKLTARYCKDSGADGSCYLVLIGLVSNPSIYDL